MRTVMDLKEVNPTKDNEFEFNKKVFERRLHIKTFFEKIFDADILAAYIDNAAKHPTKNDLEWGTSTIILFMKRRKILTLSNSEWASIHVEVLQPKKRPPVSVDIDPCDTTIETSNR